MCGKFFFRFFFPLEGEFLFFSLCLFFPSLFSVLAFLASKNSPSTYSSLTPCSPMRRREAAACLFCWLRERERERERRKKEVSEVEVEIFLLLLDRAKKKKRKKGNSPASLHLARLPSRCRRGRRRCLAPRQRRLRKRLLLRQSREKRALPLRQHQSSSTMPTPTPKNSKTDSHSRSPRRSHRRRESVDPSSLD